MLQRRRTVLLALLAAWSCGDDPIAPGELDPQIAAVNGASHPALLPGDTLVAIGHGFGTRDSGRVLLVSSGSGLTPAPIVAWSDLAVTAVLPDDAVSGSLVIVRAPGDTLGPVPLFVRASDPFDPAALTWKAGGDLPVPLAGADMAALRYAQGQTLSALVAIMGGDSAPGMSVSTAFLTAPAADANPSSWTEAVQDSAVPARRRLHAVAAADRTTSLFDAEDALFESAVYVVGGLDSASQPISDVIAMGLTSGVLNGGLDPNGYSFWTPLQTIPARRGAAAAVAALGKVYVAGGFGSDQAAATSVYLAEVRPTGELNGWFEGPSLPEPRALGALVVHDAALYFIGGQAGIVDPDSTDPASADLRGTVWRARLSRRTGFFVDTVWTAVGQLAQPRSRHAAFVLSGGILVTAGVYSGMPSPGESEFAAFQPDGTLGPFTPVAAPTIADGGGGALRDLAFATVWDAQGVPHPVIAGGRDAQGAVRQATWWH